MGILDFLARLWPRRQAPGRRLSLKEIFQGFKEVLAANNEVLALMGDLEEDLASVQEFQPASLGVLLSDLDEHLTKLVAALSRMSGGQWPELENVRRRLQKDIQQRLLTSPKPAKSPLVAFLGKVGPEIWAALGGKAANLARMVADLHLPVPPAAASSFAAYWLFLEDSPQGSPSLAARLKEKLAALEGLNQAGLEQIAADLQALVLSHPLPEELSQALEEAAGQLAPQPHDYLAVRSSGLQEDLAATFAGQFDSFLGVRPEEIVKRWRQVVASMFSLRSLAYCQEYGFSLEKAAMGVLIQRLVEARSAGVMFTSKPEGYDQDQLVVSATWGLGPELAGGEVSGDEFRLTRSGELIEFRLAPKEHRLGLQDGRLVREPVEPAQVGAPSLEPADFKALAEAAQVLEDYFGGPQDVEWVKDREGRLWVVQSRPLRISPEQARLAREAAAVESHAEALLTEGVVGAAGVGAGPVFHLQRIADLSAVPEGVVLVVPRTTPKLAPVLSRVAALIADVGSPTGHLALVARERGIPALVDTHRASELLPPGEVVTVDAYRARVYRGRVEEILRLPGRRPQLLQFPFYEQLRAVADLILPLTMVDPRSHSFRPENCLTYHDVAYFAHEKAMHVMFGLMDQVAEGRVPGLRLLKLDTPLPLNLHLVDLGDGLASHQSPVPPEDIVSIPMRALWRGISHPGISWAGPVPVDMGGFLHVLGQAAIRPPENFWDKTYAIVAANYVNYACRLGYHYQSVDSYVSARAEENYLNFNFKGGAADELRRIRRARLILTVLESLRFEVEQHKDVIRARYRKRPMPEMEERLDLLGRLMAYLRQMDMLMAQESYVKILAERFLAGHYERPGELTSADPGDSC